MEEAQSLCERVAMLQHGRLEEVNTPQGMIEALGCYTVDYMTAAGTVSRYFHERGQAITYLSELEGKCTLRDTTLEDVFIERAAQKK